MVFREYDSAAYDIVVACGDGQVFFNVVGEILFIWRRRTQIIFADLAALEKLLNDRQMQIITRGKGFEILVEFGADANW